MKVFAQFLYMFYSKSLYDQIMQNQVGLSPFLARKRAGH